jgi:ABC-type uncharacterized transport system permease subunit
MTGTMTSICIAAETLALSGYLTAAIVYPLRLVRPDSDYSRLGLLGLTGAATLQGMGLAAHTLGRSQPLFGQYANVAFVLVLMLCAALWWSEYRTERPAIAAFITPVIFLIALTGMLRPAAVPHITNPLLLVHVTLALLAYALFGVAFAMAMAYLVNDFYLKHKQVERLPLLPPLPTADRVGHMAVCIGLPIYTLAILIGASRVWLGHLGADPKTVLAPVNWCVYALYLYLRDVPHVRGKRLQALLVLGFLMALSSIVFAPHSATKYYG